MPTPSLTVLPAPVICANNSSQKINGLSATAQSIQTILKLKSDLATAEAAPKKMPLEWYKEIFDLLGHGPIHLKIAETPEKRMQRIQKLKDCLVNEKVRNVAEIKTRETASFSLKTACGTVIDLHKRS